MKKIMILFVAGLFVQNAWSADYAIDRGSVLLGGSISFSTTNATYKNYYGTSQSATMESTRIAPNIGLFIKKGLLVGPALDIAISKESSSTAVQAGYGFKASYYFDSSTQRIYPRLGVAYLFTNMSSGGNTVYTGNMVVPNIGLEFMLSQKVSLSIELGYNIHSYKYTREYVSSAYYYSYYVPESYQERTLYLALGVSAFYF